MLDMPTKSAYVRIGECKASHQQHKFDCKNANNGKRDQAWNGWAYNGHLPAWIHLYFWKNTAKFVNKVWIKQCSKILHNHPYCLKKIKISFYSPSTGWRAPGIKKVSLNDGGKATFTDDGNIELHDMRTDIRIYFDIIDASEVWIDVYESFHPNNNAVVNEIDLYNAGILINIHLVITSLLFF